jgi:broad specificity phosphatase PhoE
MFFFVRHGQTDGNLGKLDYYSNDTPLNEIGVLEAYETGKYLKQYGPFNKVISSPLVRTRQTTNEILKNVKILDETITYDDRLVEIQTTKDFDMKFKDDEYIKKKFGTTPKEIKDSYNIHNDNIKYQYDLYELFAKALLSDPKNETGKSYYDRTIDFINTMKKMAEDSPNGKFLIVCHGGTCYYLSSVLTNFWTIAESFPYDKKNNLGKSNCVIGLIKYTDDVECWDFKMPKKEFVFITEFTNRHLKSLYDNLKPIFILFTPYGNDANIWFNKINHNDITETATHKIDFIEKLKINGDVYIDVPLYNNYLDPYLSENDIKFNLEDIEFENYSTNLFNKLENEYKEYFKYRKLICIGLDMSCVYAFYFSNRYKNKCAGLCLIQNRRFNEKNYLKTKERLNRSLSLKYQNSNDNKMVTQFINDINITTKNLHKLLTLYEDNELKYEDIITYYVILSIRRQYNSLPDKCTVPTYIYNNITLDKQTMITYNMKDENTKFIKNINSENEAIMEHALTNMDKYDYDKTLVNNTEDKSLIRGIYYFSESAKPFMIYDDNIRKNILKNIEEFSK